MVAALSVSEEFKFERKVVVTVTESSGHDFELVPAGVKSLFS